jgi:hypothetical protein
MTMPERSSVQTRKPAGKRNFTSAEFSTHTIGHGWTSAPYYYELRWFYGGNYFCSSHIISESCPIPATGEPGLPQKPSGSPIANAANVCLVRTCEESRINSDGLKALKFSP